MLNPPAPSLPKTTRTEMPVLCGEAKRVLAAPPKAVSPFGGRASFISFLGQIGFAREGQPRLPFAEPTANNAILRAPALTAFLLSGGVGTPRFAQL